MSTKDLQLRVQLMIAEAGKILRPLQAIREANSKTSEAIKITKERLNQLNQAGTHLDGLQATLKAQRDAQIELRKLNQLAGEDGSRVGDGIRAKLGKEIAQLEQSLKPLRESVAALSDKNKLARQSWSDKRTEIAELNKALKATQQEHLNARDKIAALNKLQHEGKALTSAQTSEYITLIERQRVLLQTEKDSRASLKQLNLERRNLKQAHLEASSASNKLNAELFRAEKPLIKLKEQSADAERAAKRLSDRINLQRDLVSKLKEKLNAAGVSTESLSGAQKDLSKQIAEANRGIERQHRLQVAKAAMDKSMAWKSRLQESGMGAIGMGAAVGAPVVKAVKDYASFEDAMMGVARQVDGAKDANGRYTQTYYEMGDAIKAMSERIPLATTNIAAIVEAGARMGIQGKENLLTYAETTAIMASAFDLPVEQVGEDVAKIAALYKVPIKSIGELGDTINWLDDNAQSKGVDIIDVMKRIAGTADTVGMKYRDAAALASTFLSLGAATEVAGSASNAIMTNLSIATMQSNKFKGGLAMLGMNDKTVQAGMSKDATGTILRVMDAIKALPQEKQLEATTRLFGKEFGDDAAKLAANLGEYRRQLELTNAVQAKGSMQREADSRSQALSARYEILKNTIFNVSSALGESLKPALVDIMQSIADVLSNVRAWAKEHPELTANLVKGAAIISGLVVGLGALAIGVGAVLVPLAAMKFAMASFPAAGAVLGWLNPLAKLTAAFAAGYATGTLLADGFDWLVSRVLGYKTTLGGAIFDLVQWLKNASWADIGMAVVHGIEAGIDLATLGLYSKVQNVAVGMWKTAKEALGIHSPSRVFAELGGFTMQGLGQGLEAGQRGPLDAVRDTAKKLAAIGAGITLGGAAMAMPTLPALPGVAGLSRTIADQHQAIALPEIPSAVRDILDRHQQTTLPDVAGLSRTISDQHQAIALPEIPSAVRDILDRHQQATLPGVTGLSRTIADQHQAIALPDVPASVRDILDRHQQTTLPGVTGLSRTIADQHQAIALPEVPASVRDILDRHQQTTLPDVAGLSRTISDQHQAIALPEIPSAVRDILDRHQQATLPGVTGLSRTISDQHLALNLPGVQDVVRNIRDQHFLEADDKSPLIDRTSPIQWDNRPPISQARSISQVQAAPFQPIFHIYPPPGADAEEIGRMIEQKLAALQRQQAAATRSRLTDKD